MGLVGAHGPVTQKTAAAGLRELKRTKNRGRVVAVLLLGLADTDAQVQGMAKGERGQSAPAVALQTSSGLRKTPASRRK